MLSLGAGYLYSSRFGDLVAPPDETGFERYTRTVPDDENAYVYLTRAIESLELNPDYIERYVNNVAG